MTAPAAGDAARPCRLLLDGAAPGARNMAVDEALMASARRGAVTLRFYRWEPACLSFGRHQAARGTYDPERIARAGHGAVRRPTGGRAVFHGPELTYAVTAPAAAWGGLRESYARINRALRTGLRALGVEADVAAPARPRRAPRPGPRACFRDPLPGELTVGGRKLVGSAQWRRGGALLQHGSLLLRNAQRVAAACRVDGPPPGGAGETGGEGGAPGAEDGTETPPAEGAVGLEELLSPLPSAEALALALAAGFARELGLAPRPGGLSAAEREEARRLEAVYRDDAWTWRR